MIILTKQKIKKVIIYFIIIAGILSAIILHLDRERKKQEVVVTSTNNSGSRYEILVDVEESILYLFQDNQVIKTYSCSGGKWSTPSPIGTWKIIQKAKWGEGFRRKLDGNKCTLGQVWNTWNIRTIFCWMGELTWVYKNE